MAVAQSATRCAVVAVVYGRRRVAVRVHKVVGRCDESVRGDSIVSDLLCEHESERPIHVEWLMCLLVYKVSKPSNSLIFHFKHLLYVILVPANIARKNIYRVGFFHTWIKQGPIYRFSHGVLYL